MSIIDELQKKLKKGMHLDASDIEKIEIDIDSRIDRVKDAICQARIIKDCNIIMTKLLKSVGVETVQHTNMDTFIESLERVIAQSEQMKSITILHKKLAARRSSDEPCTPEQAIDKMFKFVFGCDKCGDSNRDETYKKRFTI